jgi:NB-ARC domain
VPAAAATAAGHEWRVCFRLPLAVAHFTGRDAELDAIDAALGVADRAVVTQAITGLGGVGKSQLAVRYVHQHADEYDIVAWIRAEDGGIADLSELAAELGLPVAGLTPAERAASAVRWLSGCDERWLLVLDNVAAPEQLRDCCPAAGKGRVIVTTRDRGIAQFGPALRVDVFEEATAVAYLLRISGRAEDRDGATRLARALGLLPLALSHAGAYCAAGTSFDDYLDLLGALPAVELFDRHPEASYAQTVASTWQVSIQRAEREAPLARQVLAMAAHLAPDAIPRELFDVLLEDTLAAAGRKRLLDAFNALHRLSLAEVDDDTISVHRLLQKTIRDDALQRGDMTAAVSALTAVSTAFPSDHDQPQTWPRSERLLAHALAIPAEFMRPGEEGQRLVMLLNSASDYLIRADQGTRAVDVATRASAHAQRILGGEHPATLRAGATLGLSYGSAGRWGVTWRRSSSGSGCSPIARRSSAANTETRCSLASLSLR